MADFAERINPRNLGFSPKLVAIVGAIIHHDYGVRDRKGNLLSGFSVTSDGYAISGGAFLGDIGEIEQNLRLFRGDLSESDRAEFDRLYVQNVLDYRR